MSFAAEYPSRFGAPPPPGSYRFDPRGPFPITFGLRMGFSGLGATAPTQGITLPSGQTAAQAALGTGLTISSAAITSAATTGASIGSSATWLAAAGGPIGLAVAGVTIALIAVFKRKRPGQKRATTEIVNDVEPELVKNLNGYFAGPRTAASQAQALANFDAGWQWVTDNCGQAAMGDPGHWCIDDRKPGGQWDWFARYRDPIANDVPVASSIPSPSQIFSGDVSLNPAIGWAMIAGLVVLGATL
jgi:hypothetical protein